jgi:hypothetical protein
MTPHSREIPADEEGRHAWEVSSNAQVAEEWRPSSGKGAASPCLRTIGLRGSQPADLLRYLEGADEEAFGSTRVVRRPVEPFGDPCARLDRRAGARGSEEPGSSDPFRRKRSSYHSEPEARRIRSHPFDTRSALSAAKAARASVSSYKGFRSCQGNRQVRSVGEKASAAPSCGSRR